MIAPEEFRPLGVQRLGRCPALEFITSHDCETDPNHKARQAKEPEQQRHQCEEPNRPTVEGRDLGRADDLLGAFAGLFELRLLLRP